MFTGMLLCLLSALPVGAAPAPLEQPWFPDRVHAFVWTNWGLVPLETMAKVIGGAPEELAALGERMGLGAPREVSRAQQERSYITVIRRNWHLLPYDQLLTLLGWTEKELEYTLREDDFLYIKLGSLKPASEPLRYSPPDEAALARAASLGDRIRAAMPKGPCSGSLTSTISTPPDVAASSSATLRTLTSSRGIAGVSRVFETI